MFYFARCINIIFNSLLAQLVKYDVHPTGKIKFIHAIFYHILLFYAPFVSALTLLLTHLQMDRQTDKTAFSNSVF